MSGTRRMRVQSVLYWSVADRIAIRFLTTRAASRGVPLRLGGIRFNSSVQYSVQYENFQVVHTCQQLSNAFHVYCVPVPPTLHVL